jgi:hypothetical protein
VNTAALRQAMTPEHLYGRTGGAMSFLTQSAKPLGSLFGGAVATAIGLHPTLWVCAAGGLLVIPWTIFSPLRRGSDDRRDRGAHQHGGEGLAVDLPELADGGQEDGEHESEHPGRRREGAHQLLPGSR